MSISQTAALKVRFRGVRGSISAPGAGTARYGGNTSCVELRCGDQILVLDAGTGIRSLGADLVEEFGSRSIAASLLISHTHWDHIQGLPFFAPLYAAQNRIQLIGANGDQFALERALRNQMQSLHFPVTLDEMLGLSGFAHMDSQHMQLGEFRIERIALNHPGGCAGFRISACGVSVAYLPDHEPYRHVRNGANGTKNQPTMEELTRFVRGVDLLILDTQYTETEYKQRIGWGHGCLTDSVALAVEAGVHRLSFFHHDPSHLDDQIDEMVRDARRLVDPLQMEIDAASENQIILLGGEGENGFSNRQNGQYLTVLRDHPANPIFLEAARRKVSFRRK